jgi:hypothetical protein
MTYDQLPLTAFALLFGGLIMITPLQAPAPGFGPAPFTEFWLILPGLAAGLWAGCSGFVQSRHALTSTAIFSMLAGIFSLGYLVVFGLSVLG